MSYAETIAAILVLLGVPEGQNWVSIDDLKKQAEKLDGGKE